MNGLGLLQSAPERKEGRTGGCWKEGKGKRISESFLPSLPPFLALFWSMLTISREKAKLPCLPLAAEEGEEELPALGKLLLDAPLQKSE